MLLHFFFLPGCFLGAPSFVSGTAAGLGTDEAEPLSSDKHRFNHSSPPLLSAFSRSLHRSSSRLSGIPRFILRERGRGGRRCSSGDVTERIASAAPLYRLAQRGQCLTRTDLSGKGAAATHQSDAVTTPGARQPTSPSALSHAGSAYCCNLSWASTEVLIKRPNNNLIQHFFI